MIEQIEWLGHGSFRIQGPPLIYIDPWRVARDIVPADAILVTHDHYDHCSPADVEKLRGPNTVVITNAMGANVLNNVTVLRPWQVLNVGRACIKAVPAYNAHHPPEFECLGFVISINHYDIYYAGDTDFIPEMSKLKPDIAILPIGGKQTMGVDEAIKVVQQMRPRYVIPSHWGSPAEGGSVVDVKMFAKGIEGLAEIVQPERVR